MANEKTPVVWDDTTKKHRPLGTGEKMGGLDASSIISSDSGNLIQTGSDGLALVTGSSLADPRADNLLETSGNGKLQVTVDRIAEWLDGHPQDAAALAEAINVVSGDEGNVITAGSDKGAFLSKAAIGAALQGLTDAQKQALAAALANQLASQLADGHTIVASNGKLKSDPTNATAAEKKAINQALADADSGLVVDNSTGKLKVDFSNMPTDKFEDLLKSLDMLVPLRSNLNLYVDTNSSAAGDDIVDGRGTQAKPFKTIQACVTYVTGTYSLGRYSVYINVGAGTYEESVSLPGYSRGTGGITIRSTSGARDVVVSAPLRASDGMRLNCFSSNGGFWRLRHLSMKRVENPTTGRGMVGSCVSATGDAVVYLAGVAVDSSFPSSPSPLGGNRYGVRLIVADNGGRIDFEHDVLPTTIHTEAGTGIDTAAIVASRDGSIYLRANYDDQSSPATTGEVQCSGSCDVFVSVSSNGSIKTLGSGTLTSFTGTVDAKRYQVESGSNIETRSNGSATFFPGDEAGTVEDSTYCWYK